MHRITKIRQWSTAFALGLVFLGAGAANGADIYYYGMKTVNGKVYQVYLEDYGGRAELWCRVKKDASSTGDVKVAVLERKKQSIDPRMVLKDAAKALCTVKKIYDESKTVVGCASVAASGVCLAASVPSGGTAAAFCSATLAYGIAGGGFADCLDGVRDWIGSKLIGDSDWSLIATQVSITNAQWKNAISYAIDAACGKQ